MFNLPPTLFNTSRYVICLVLNMLLTKRHQTIRIQKDKDARILSQLKYSDAVRNRVNKANGTELMKTNMLRANVICAVLVLIGAVSVVDISDRAFSAIYYSILNSALSRLFDSRHAYKENHSIRSQSFFRTLFNYSGSFTDQFISQS